MPSGRSRGMTAATLQLIPFAIFATMFLLLPTSYLFIGAFQDQSGHFTFGNIAKLFTPSVLNAYTLSIEISLASSVLGALLGTAVAWSIKEGALPNWVRQGVTTLSGVTSNFAGVPLAFAFLATLGRTGLVTALLSYLGFDLYRQGFSIYNVFGLTLTYLYFQLPLMVLVVLPAIDGLKKEWNEASAMLGATPTQHFFGVTLPILAPSVLGAALLLFANSFGAVATAFALTSGSINLITILLFAQIRGDVLHDANLGYALAFGMVVITGLCNLGYLWLRSVSERRSA